MNLSITRAYNKTKGKIAPPENVIYTTSFSAGNSIYGKDVIPMQMSSFCPSNSLKCTENTLEINKEYFNNIDKKIQGLLDSYAKNGQLSKNSKNLDQIELLTSYHYDKTLLDNNMLQTRNAIGVDELVYHELGHSWHSKTVNFEDYEKCFAPYEALADKITSIKVSKYAGENGSETVGEIVKGVLSGDKYSDDVMQLGNQLTNGKLQFLC